MVFGKKSDPPLAGVWRAGGSGCPGSLSGIWRRAGAFSGCLSVLSSSPEKRNKQEVWVVGFGLFPHTADRKTVVVGGAFVFQSR